MSVNEFSKPSQEEFEYIEQLIMEEQNCTKEEAQAIAIYYHNAAKTSIALLRGLDNNMELYQRITQRYGDELQEEIKSSIAQALSEVTM